MKCKNVREGIVFMIINSILCFSITKANSQHNESGTEIEIEFETRRILSGSLVHDTRPYMVYLRPANLNIVSDQWTCGGVIIDPNFILTSAACIEDVEAFYVVSGTDKWYSFSVENECVKNGAKRADWKVIPKNYHFDGREFENIRWMNHDIALVKLEESINFHKRVRGCDYIPTKISYNVTEEMLKPGTKVTVSGWGARRFFGEHEPNSPKLLEAEATIISPRACKARWPERYHYIIDSSMICTEERSGSTVKTLRRMTGDCVGTKCGKPQKVEPKDEIENVRFQDVGARRLIANPETYVHTNSWHRNDGDRRFEAGGICQNDHGGPLIHGQGKVAVVIGIISACQTNDATRQCFGPFLYTNVLKHLLMIRCAIDVNADPSCKDQQFQRTLFHWPDDDEEKEDIYEVKPVEVTTVMPDNVNELLTQLPEEVKTDVLNNTRRIINGHEVRDGRPYMVYLKLPNTNTKLQSYKSWLCGGIIIHEEYILTSAACIQDAGHFYVVSGTYKYSEDSDKSNNRCIKNGAKKAIWKCVPKNYVFDGHENDNIRWMNNDIAIVKVEDGFDFHRRVKGCDFVPKPICYNNQSKSFENPGTIASIAGWGSTERYNDWVNRRKDGNQPSLLQAMVEIVPKGRCKRRWGSRYFNIIDNYMICTKDLGQSMSEVCNEKYVDCQNIDYSEDEEYEETRRAGEIPISHKTDQVPLNMFMHSGYHNDTKNVTVTGVARKFNSPQDKVDASGGFCENDHGGPLVYGDGANAVVIGIISACLVKENSNKCYGPFLYTSLYKNRQFISCAIYKDVEPECRRQFRSGVTHEEQVISWLDHPEGPAKNEVAQRVNGKYVDMRMGTEVPPKGTLNPENPTVEVQTIEPPEDEKVLRAHRSSEEKKEHPKDVRLPAANLTTTAAKVTTASEVVQGATVNETIKAV